MPNHRERRTQMRKEKTGNKPSMFFGSSCIYESKNRRFGLCDKEPPPSLPAYIDEINGKDWIAVVDNFYQISIIFVALDNCIILKRPNGERDKCCDGVLLNNGTVTFVELTTRTDTSWRKEKEEQLRATINHFENTKEADPYKVKRAYIANNKKPVFSRGQEVRINNFLKDTGYVLRITNRIKII